MSAQPEPEYVSSSAITLNDQADAHQSQPPPTVVEDPISPCGSAEASPRIRLEINPTEATAREQPEQDSQQLPQAADSADERRGSLRSNDSGRGPRSELWLRRQYHTWKSPLLMSVFFVTGLALSVAHCALYAALDGTIVRSPEKQVENLRQAVISYTSVKLFPNGSNLLVAMRQIRDGPFVPVTNCFECNLLANLSTVGLKICREADESGNPQRYFWSRCLSAGASKSRHAPKVHRRLWHSVIRLGSYPASFLHAGHVFVYDSTDKIVGEQRVPFLTIANCSEGDYYAYSPDDQGHSYKFEDAVTRTFMGPRTVLTRLSTATAAGEMLPLPAPYNRSSYTVRFFGPAVQCLEAGPALRSEISTQLKIQKSKTIMNATEIQNAYYGFVPAHRPDGSFVALDEVRYQAPLNASNEFRMVFSRYNSSTGPYTHERHYQNISGSRQLMHSVEYPNDKPGDVSNLAQHAYSAFRWVLADQVVGFFGLFEATDPANSSKTRLFDIIRSPIQHNVLLGSRDLSPFFDYNQAADACREPFHNQSSQRQQNMNLARNRTLPELIEELSFNMTVSLMHDNLLTDNVARLVTRWERVNRYGYSPTGLFIPYALACSFTLIVVLFGAATYVKHGVMPGKKFQDILAAAGNDSVQVVRAPDARRSSLMIKSDGVHRIFSNTPNAEEHLRERRRSIQ